MLLIGNCARGSCARSQQCAGFVLLEGILASVLLAVGAVAMVIGMLAIVDAADHAQNRLTAMQISEALVNEYAVWFNTAGPLLVAPSGGGMKSVSGREFSWQRSFQVYDAPAQAATATVAISWMEKGRRQRIEQTYSLVRWLHRIAPLGDAAIVSMGG